NAVELGDAEIGDAVIDDGLGVIQQLWQAGLAHRDIKPANVLIRNDRVLLIDVAFAEVRPTPWRQAVDLANMMLCLALRTTPERVYERARGWLTAAGWPRAWRGPAASPGRRGSAGPPGRRAPPSRPVSGV